MGRFGRSKPPAFPASAPFTLSPNDAANPLTKRFWAAAFVFEWRHMIAEFGGRRAGTWQE